jgi:hypothetical protein
VIAQPASAASREGCAVAPFKPVVAGLNESGVKIIEYRIKVNCSAGRTVFIQQQRWERDYGITHWRNSDDWQGASTFTRSYLTAAGSTTISVRRALSNTEGDEEEPYHRVRFRVASGGVTGAFTPWQATAWPVVPD